MKDSTEILNKRRSIKEDFINTKILNHRSNNTRPFSNTSNRLIKNNNLKLTFAKEFTGFFNKKFDLTLYKKNRDNSRAKSKSQKKIILHQKRGNGIPNNIIDRITFLGKKFNEPKFVKYYNK